MCFTLKICYASREHSENLLVYNIYVNSLVSIFFIILVPLSKCYTYMYVCFYVYVLHIMDYNPHMGRTCVCFSSCDWVNLVNIISPSIFLQVLWFCFSLELSNIHMCVYAYTYTYMYHIFIIHSLLERYLSCLHFLAVLNRAAVNLGCKHLYHRIKSSLCIGQGVR